MELTEERREEIFVLGIKGRLDVNTSLALEKKLQEVLAVENRLVIDLSQLDYISSSGLQTLLMAAIRANDSNQRLAFCSLQSQIKEVFDMAGFSSIFRIYDNQAEALRRVQ